jgi:hypothetical protein
VFAIENNRQAHGSLERVFRAEIRERLQFLEENPTGRQEGRSGYLIALDEFTQVVVAAEAAKDRQQIVQKEAALDTEAGRIWHEQQLLNPGQQTRQIAEDSNLEDKLDRPIYSPIDPFATAEGRRNSANNTTDSLLQISRTLTPNLNEQNSRKRQRQAANSESPNVAQAIVCL